MKLLVLLLAWSMTIGVNSAFAQGQDRFVEVRLSAETATFDLNTVKEVQPGRFIIAKTSMHHPELMRFELNALRKLQSHCSSAIGTYSVPPDLLIAGTPDLPVTKIEVKPSMTGYSSNPKAIEWKYPYKKFAWSDGDPRSMIFRCWSKTEFSEQYNLITNGLHTREIYDCRNALDGWLLKPEDDPTKATMLEVHENTTDADEYIRVCMAVYHEKPREPWPR
jgi:hypothetical protein